MDNKVGNLLNAIDERIASKLAQAEEVKSVTIINQPPSQVKIKSPSKLFKHISPNGKETRDPSYSSGPIHFVNTITTMPDPKPNKSQQPTRNEDHEVESRAPKKERDVTENPIDLPKNPITQGSSERKELEEESKGIKENPGVVDNSIMKKIKKGTVGLSVGLRNRIGEGDSHVFKISSTTRKNLILDAYVDPDFPINAISLSLYNDTFPEQVTCEDFNLGSQKVTNHDGRIHL